MASFRWGKFSGRSRGAGHGGKGRIKCEKIDSKDALKRKENECTRKRGFWRGRCMKTLVASASISTTACPNLSGISKPASDNHSLQVAKLNRKADTCESIIDGQCKEELHNKSCNFDCEWHKTCLEDVKQNVRSSACLKDGVCAGCVRNSRVSSKESGCMAYVWQDALSGEKWECIGACTDSDVCEKAEHQDFEEAYVGKAGKEASLQSLDSKGRFGAHLDCEKMEEVDDIVHDAGTMRTDELSTKKRAVGLLMVPHDFVCGMSNKVMEDPVVVASGRTFERASIQAWLDGGNTHCPLTHKPLSHFQLIPNLTLKTLISSWLSSASPDPGLEATQTTFASCMSSFSACPSSMTGSHLDFVSCSSFSISKLLEDMELPSFSSSLSSSLPKLLMDAEMDSFSSSSSTSAYCSSTPKHLRVGPAQNLSSTAHSPGSSFCWEEELQHASQEIKVSECIASESSMQAENRLVLSKISQECSLHSMLNDLMSRSRGSSEYTMSRIDGLVCDLQSDHIDIQRSAVAELRLLAKHEDRNRVLIASAGAVKLLISLLRSADESIQLEATTALLNLSLNHALKERIVKEGASEALVEVLRNGLRVGVKENAAVALAHLAACEANRGKIGFAGAVTPLVNLLESGSLRGKKDAAAALYRLSSVEENKRRMVSAGALRLLVGFMSNGGDKEGMVDKAMAILRNLVSIEEGRVAFVEAGGIMSLLQVIEAGSQRSRGLAVPILFQLCIHSGKHRSLVLQKDPLPTLMSISKTGNSRLKSQVARMIEVLIVDA